MLWQDYHNFEFVTPDDKYRFVGYQETIDEFDADCADMQEKPQWQYKLASKTKIDSLLNKHKQLDYTYDLGDFWNIEIELEASCENYAKPYATCVDGENPAPPEDVGGLDGYQQFLEAFRDPENEQHEEMLDWCEGWKEKFDRRAINAVLRGVILKRNSASSKVKKAWTKRTPADNIIDISSPQAKWLALPKILRDKLLKNGYCANCGGVTEIVDYKVSSDKSGIFIEGKCKKCGGQVVRCLD